MIAIATRRIRTRSPRQQRSRAHGAGCAFDDRTSAAASRRAGACASRTYQRHASRALWWRSRASISSLAYRRTPPLPFSRSAPSRQAFPFAAAQGGRCAVALDCWSALRGENAAYEVFDDLLADRDAIRAKHSHAIDSPKGKVATVTQAFSRCGCFLVQSHAVVRCVPCCSPPLKHVLSSVEGKKLPPASRFSTRCDAAAAGAVSTEASAKVGDLTLTARHRPRAARRSRSPATATTS